MTTPTLRQIAMYMKRSLAEGVPIDHITVLVAAELVQSKRQSLLPELIRTLLSLYELQDAQAAVTIETAEELSATTLSSITNALQKNLQLTFVHTEHIINPKLVAGFRAQTAAQEIDVSGQRLLSQLTQGWQS